jgi:ATP/maltotriose-dependent transcriptional regulator MalT
MPRSAAESAPAHGYKSLVPITDGQVPRRRVHRELDRALRDFPLVWVRGLPGSGKTTAVAQWFTRARRAPGVAFWYRLDETDGDGAALFDAIRREAGPELAQVLPAWSPAHQLDLGSFARRFFHALGQAGPLRLVLDDCHRLAPDAALFAALEALRELGRRRVQAVFISRGAPPDPFELGVAGGWLGQVDDLLVDAAEAAAIARLRLGRALTTAERERLSAAGGWIAHLLMLVRAPDPVRGGAVVAGASPDARVGDYLAAQWLDMLPPAERAALRRAAEAPEVTAEVLRALGAGTRVTRLLSELAAQRYFVDVTARGAWRLHDLLRDALLRCNQREDRPPLLGAARRALGLALRDREPEAAAALLARAGDTPGLLALLARHGDAWLATGRHAPLEGWLNQLAEAGHTEDDCDQAWLALWRAEAWLPTAPEAARPLYEQARQRLAARGDPVGAYRAWCGEVASYVVQWGAVAGLARRVDELEALHAQLGPPVGAWRFRVAADALTALMYGRPEDERMASYARAAEEALPHAPDPGARITAAAQLLIYKLWWAGDFAGGRAIYAAFDAEVARSEHLAPLPRLVWWSCAAIVDWQCGRAQDCYDKVERGLALAESSGVHVRDFFLLTQGMFCALSGEDMERANSWLERLARTEHSHPRLDVMVHYFFRSWHALSSGDAALARAHAETALPLARELGSTFHTVIVLSALAPARLHAGDVAGALAAYREQMELAKRSRNPTFAFIAFCAGAEIALAQGDEPRLVQQMQRMLTVKQLGGFHSTCGWRTPMMARLLAVALERGILPEVARQWIVEKRIARPASYAGSDWPVPIWLRARGVLEVRAASGLPPLAQGGRRLRELLMLLIVEREGLSSAALADALWPETEGDKAATALKVSIHRLRQWLGPAVVLVRDGWVRLNPAWVDCDLWQAMDRGERVDR